MTTVPLHSSKITDPLDGPSDLRSQLGCWRCWDSRQPVKSAREKLDRKRRQCREGQMLAAAPSIKDPIESREREGCRGRERETSCGKDRCRDRRWLKLWAEA